MTSIQKIASAKKSGKAVYRVQVRTKGQSRSAKFPSLQEAKEWAASTEASFREGRHFPHLRAQRTTFAELVQRYHDGAVGGAERATFWGASQGSGRIVVEARLRGWTTTRKSAAGAQVRLECPLVGTYVAEN